MSRNTELVIEPKTCGFPVDTSIAITYGPFLITHVGTRACTLNLGGGWNIFPNFHVSMLELNREFTHPERPQVRPPMEEIEGELEYREDQIILSENRTARRAEHQTQWIFYLIKWPDYPKDKSFWNPLKSLTGAMNTVAEFHRINQGVPKLYSITPSNIIYFTVTYPKFPALRALWFTIFPLAATRPKLEVL